MSLCHSARAMAAVPGTPDEDRAPVEVKLCWAVSSPVVHVIGGQERALKLWERESVQDEVLWDITVLLPPGDSAASSSSVGA